MRKHPNTGSEFKTLLRTVDNRTSGLPDPRTDTFADVALALQIWELRQEFPKLHPWKKEFRLKPIKRGGITFNP